MNKPIRVLHVVTYMGFGGLETMIMNYYRNIDRTKVQFDFLTHRLEKAAYDDEIEKLGGKIYHLPKLNPFSPYYIKKLNEFFIEHKEYDIVHCHQDCLSGVVLKYAKKNGVKFTIAHAHSSNQNKNLKYLIKLLEKKKIKKYADYLFACSKKAGEWMFETNNFEVLNNAIDIDLYNYNEEKSLYMKKKLGIEEKFVIGHVGSFYYPKNHKFIIKLFNEICTKNSNTVLVLVGDGSLKDEIQNEVDKLGIKDNVMFLGHRKDVNDLMQAMDVFIFPSIYEGLGLVLIEAQAAGLKCIVSDRIPDEAIITDDIVKINLEDKLSYWVDRVLENYPKYDRKNNKEQIEKANYDIKSNARKLEEFYLDRSGNK